MTTVREILQYPTYAGDMVWNRRTSGKFHRIAMKRAVPRRESLSRALEENPEDDWIVVRDAHPAN